LAAIEKLSIEKYQTWDWIFGYSPKYRFSNSWITSEGSILISFLVEKGVISEALCTGALSAKISHQISELLVGCRHDSDSISQNFQKMGTDLNFDIQDFLKALF
jgi:lipoate-protein ligase A